MSSYDNWSARGRAPADDEAGLCEALNEGDARVRQDAAVALVDAAEGGLDPQTSVELRRRVNVDEDPQVRQFAVEALGVDGTGRNAVETALDDPEEWVRAEAVVACSRIAPGETERLIGLLDDDSGWVRRNAVVALGKTGGADHDLLVETIKTDPHPAVREYAAQFLGDAVADVEEAERILAALLAREPNAFVRAKAAESLGQLGSDRAEQALEDHGITDASDDVARTAKRALAEARGVDPDSLDVDIEDPTAPGGGPGTREEHRDQGFRPPGAQAPGEAPGGGEGFDPTSHLDADMSDR